MGEYKLRSSEKPKVRIKLELSEEGQSELHKGKRIRELQQYVRRVYGFHVDRETIENDEAVMRLLEIN